MVTRQKIEDDVQEEKEEIQEAASSSLSSSSDDLEVVVTELQTIKSVSRHWIQISCVSPSELVLCDRASLFIIRRQPTLNDLMELIDD